MQQTILPSWWKTNKPIKLPVLSKNIHLLLRLLGEQDLDYRALSLQVSYYPAIAARIIYLANSSWSAPASPISELEQACNRLGSSVVRTVGIAMAIANTFDAGRCKGFDVERFWLSSMLVADAASMLLEHIPDNVWQAVRDKTAHTAGVLHLIGLLWLADNLPLETSHALHLADEQAISLQLAMQQVLDTDYCSAGAWIAEQWNMPAVLVVSLRAHRDAEYRGAHWQMARLIGIAVNLVEIVTRTDNGVMAAELPDCDLLQISSVEQQRVLNKLLAQLEKSTELAKLMFG